MVKTEEGDLVVDESGDLQVGHEDKTNGKIELDDKTKAMIQLREAQREILANEVALILNGYLNGKGKTGNYRLNKECTELVMKEVEVE